MKINPDTLTIYFKDLLSNPQPVVEAAIPWVKDHWLVATGVSGLLFGSMLAYANGNPLCIVRKRGDNSHSLYVVENAPLTTWIFVDDFIDSGSTFKRVYKELSQVGVKATLFKGVYLYRGWTEWEDGFYQPSEFIEKAYGMSLKQFKESYYEG